MIALAAAGVRGAAREEVGRCPGSNDRGRGAANKPFYAGHFAR